MRDISSMRDAREPPASGRQICEVLEHLRRLVLDGIRVGHFVYSIACEISPGGKRRILIRGGQSRQFTIREEEVPR